MTGGNQTRDGDLTRTVVCDRGADMAALDSLGPRTRAALKASRFNWSAAALVALLRRCGADPTSPTGDRVGENIVIAEDARAAWRARVAYGPPRVRG
jgi:hypothetical protein